MDPSTTLTPIATGPTRPSRPPDRAHPAPEIEARATAIGRDLLASMGRGSPLDRAWWDDRLMAMSMAEESVKIQLFRFIDALPALVDPRSARRHLAEYLDEAGDRVPRWMAAPLAITPPGFLGDRIVSAIARTAATRMAHRFIAGSTPGEALRTVLTLRSRHLGFTADLLGEAVISEAEADAYQRTCLDLLDGLAPRLAAEPEDPQIDRDDAGPIPRANLSLKLTSLTTWFDAIAPDSTSDRVLARLRPILRKAKDLGAFVNVDMEQFAHKSLTYSIFRRALDEPEFRSWAGAGVVVQAYQPSALDDLEALRDWAAGRGAPITIRLVKGAYWDYEVLHARQAGWPIPVYLNKWESDANFERCARFLMENYRRLRPALGSHNARSLAASLAWAETLGVPPGAVEIQMLHGMAGPIQDAMVARGLRVRLYTPYGAMLPGMAYLVRRLLENTSNESFLKATAGATSPDELLRNPEETGDMWARSRPKPAGPATAPLAPFRNEPLTDFTRPEAQRAMRAALDQVRTRLEVERDAEKRRILAPIIGGAQRDAGPLVETTAPGDSTIVVSRARNATAPEAVDAVKAARAAFAGWSATPTRERADVLMRVAEAFRRDRFVLAAYEVFECGKPWREADADVAEAIDFCEFYAREMIRLDRGEARDVAGETNRIDHLARGVVVVIPPWNFPLAIPTGMVAAAIVAGNAVVLKPAEQSPLMGHILAKTFEKAGLPPGVLNYLPGVGEEVGPTLIDHPEVDLIAFTGSRAVGLEINRKAAITPPGQDHVKRVIAEMGGKNATIIDDDADLDEAVVGVLHAAFGYSGQKCSACSRVIVLDGIYDAFVHRLGEAARSVRIGRPDDPDTIIGPVIDADARDRIRRYSSIATQEGRVIFAPDLGPLADAGHYVAPVIVADVDPSARVAREEIFGPVLAILRAADIGDALRIAHGVEYALTGGIYSRSPANIERARREFRVGNLYVNRPITGALVDRQPFGGFKLSGLGSKAGGSDYLREFLLSRTVTENTMRRGFAPDLDHAPATGQSAASGV